MGISSIDLMQSDQIESLQDDVKELREKLNLLVSDITDVDGVAGATRDGLTVKLNQAIVDAGDLNSVINAGYTVASGGGSSSGGILKRMDELFAALSRHENTHTPYSYSGASGLGATGSFEETHPPKSGTLLSQPGATSGLSGTAQAGTTRSSHVSTALATNVATAPEYVLETKAMITLKTIPEKRAKILARKIQGQITAEDRVNTNK